MTMDRRRVLFLCLSFSVLAAQLVVVAAPTGEWPTRWQVNANGVSGVLELSFREDGSLIGRLLDEYVEGYVAGRHLFIRRTADDRTEVWEGWLGSSPDLIVAGTISVDEAGETTVYPWFGTPEGAAELSSSDPLPSPVPPPAVASPAPSAPAPVPSSSSDGALSGNWVTSGGERVQVVQTGNRLTVTLADGSSHDGRMTGSSTLVVGLGHGCCNGTLDDPNSITWSDGARWRRAN
jgi:hypothetical protein